MDHLNDRLIHLDADNLMAMVVMLLMRREKLFALGCCRGSVFRCARSGRHVPGYRMTRRRCSKIEEKQF